MAPVDQMNVLEPVPPVAAKLMDPVLPPLQRTFVEVAESVKAGGCVIVNGELLAAPEQPLLSVMVTE